MPDQKYSNTWSIRFYSLKGTGIILTAFLRTLKNRFGSTAELGIYEMTDEGMQEVNNPSEILITQKEEQLSGSAIAASIEGQRPLLIEVQALVTTSVYGTPQRTVSGFDLRRLQLLLAVLEKRGGFHFGVKDVFLNIAGGLKVEDPSIDLAVLCALLSSFEDVPIATRYLFCRRSWAEWRDPRSKPDRSAHC